MENMKQGKYEPKKMDVPASQEITKIDREILDSTNLINRLEADLKKETDFNKAAALKSVIEREKANKQKLLDGKFIVAKPRTEAVEEVNVDDAYAAHGQARIHKRMDDAKDQGIRF